MDYKTIEQELLENIHILLSDDENLIPNHSLSDLTQALHVIYQLIRQQEFDKRELDSFTHLGN